MSSNKQVDRIAASTTVRTYRGPRFQPLRRALKIPVWGDLGIRLGLALFLIFVVVMIHWWDREGLVDNLDGEVSFLDVIYFTMISITTTGFGDIAPISDRARLVEAWQPRLVGHAWRLTGDTEMAREAVQDGWVEILRGLSALRDEMAFPAWALRIVTRRCRRLGGRRGRDGQGSGRRRNPWRRRQKNGLILLGLDLGSTEGRCRQSRQRRNGQNPQARKDPFGTPWAESSSGGSGHSEGLFRLF